MSENVFICYSREDHEFVLNLATNLKSRGFPVWLDQWDIPSGSDWDLTIDNALYGCAHFLIILSPNSVESKEVRSELRTALDENKHIVPVLHRSCRVPRQLRLIQYIDFTSRSPDDIAALNDLLVALGKAESTLSKPAEISVPKEKFIEAKAWDNRGWDLMVQGKFDEAIEAYDKAIELNPQYAKAWIHKGNIFYDQKKYDEAVKAYDEAIRLDPNHAQTWNNKSAALRNLGRTTEANEAFAKAKKLGYKD